MKVRTLLMAGLVAAAIAGAGAQEKMVMVGGESMFPSKNIIANAMNSKDHTTLVAAVKAAGLVETLQGAGPFTVFAPTNAAFAKLPAGTIDMLLKPENKSMLTRIPHLSRRRRTARRRDAVEEGAPRATAPPSSRPSAAASCG